MTTERQRFHDEGPARKYFTQMLNMADDDLDPFQYRLLAHYIRKAGEHGICNESVRTTAKITRMGINKVQDTRDELESLGYIRTNRPTKAQARRGETVIIYIVDRWAENIARYTKNEAVSNPIQVGVSETIQGVSSPIQDAGEAVSNPIRKNNKKNQEEKTQPRVSPSKKKSATLTKRQKLLLQLEPYKGLAAAALELLDAGYTAGMDDPEHYMTVAHLEKYLPGLEDLYGRNATPEKLKALYAKLKLVYDSKGWVIGFNTLVEKFPAFDKGMLSTNGSGNNNQLIHSHKPIETIDEFTLTPEDIEAIKAEARKVAS